MPEGRMLKKKISLDKVVAQLSKSATILYTWCIPHLDLDGKIYAKMSYLKGNVVPFRDDFSERLIKKCVIEMVNSGLVIGYGDDSDWWEYLKFKGFTKNQRIDRLREAPSLIPDPTPEQLQSNSRETPREVKLSKVNISKSMASPILQVAFKNVFDKGLNIYQLLNKLKKESKVGLVVPEEVLLSVCETYLTKGNGITNKWAWFSRTVEEKWHAHNAEKNQKETEAIKDSYKKGTTAKIGDLLGSQ